MIALFTAALAGTTHFSHTVETTASPDVIWAFWTDTDTWPSWDTELESARLDGSFALDRVGELVSDGRTSTFWISEWQPTDRYAFSTRLPAGKLVVTRWLERLPDGGTRFTHDVQFRGLGGVLLSPLLGKRFKAALPGVMERLAALGENSDHPG